MLPANVHDSQPFFDLFPYVEKNFVIQYDTKFLGDSAYDSADIKNTVRDKHMKNVIAVNGRGHYKSSKPKDKDYRKRGAIERFFSILKMKMNLLNVRVKNIQKVTAHVFSCILGYLFKYIL